MNEVYLITVISNVLYISVIAFYLGSKISKVETEIKYLKETIKNVRKNED